MDTEQSNVRYIADYLREHAPLDSRVDGLDLQSKSSYQVIEHSLAMDRIQFAVEFGNLFNRSYYNARP
jgi:hypothetical protein